MVDILNRGEDATETQADHRSSNSRDNTLGYLNLGSNALQTAGSAINYASKAKDAVETTTDFTKETLGSKLAGFGSLLGGVSGILNFGLNLYGMIKQQDENARVEALGLKLRNEDISRTEFWKDKEWAAAMKKNLQAQKNWDDEFAFTKEQWSWKKADAAKDRAFIEAQDKYKKTSDFINNFTGLLNSNGQLRANLINAWGARR